MSDEKFEEFLKRETPAYNAPPGQDVPRDEMWQVIAAARTARRPMDGSPAAAPIALHGTPRSTRWRIAPWIGMAATLLLGVGIGRFALNTSTDQPAAPAAAPAASSTTAPAPEFSSGSGATETPVTLPAATPADAAPRRTVTSGAPPVRFAALPSGGTNDLATPMQVASREHLVRAEALISVVAASAADMAIDSLTSRWAREMLTSTRLLLDSPAGDDPARRLLLEDLETVLVLLVQRSGAPTDERALLDRSLERTQLLTRLRTNAAGI
jgi:hypothetical protein